VALNYTTITGTFEDGSGSPQSGSVVFTPSATVYATGGPVVSVGLSVTGKIVNGALQNSTGGALKLFATDNANVTVESNSTPGFWFWTAAVTVGPGSGQALQTFSFFLPSSPSTADLYSLAQAGAEAGAGFSNPMTTLGDMIMAGSAGAAERLAGNTGATTQVLTSTGAGSVATVPAWEPISAGMIATAPTTGTWPRPLTYSPSFGLVWGYPDEFYIDSYGNIAAATYVPDAVCTASSPTCLSAGNHFAGAVAGMPIIVSGAGTAIGNRFRDLVTTIQTVNSAGSVTLAANATTTTTAPNGAVFGPGCGAAINSAMAALTTYMEGNSSCAGKLITPPGWWLVETAEKNGSGNGFANAQVPLPLGGLNQPLNPIFVGLGGAVPGPYFNSTLPTQGGSAWVCARTDGTPNNGTFGYSSVLGGPTPQQGYGPNAGGGPLFSNIRPVIDGLSIVTPMDSSYCGMDFTCCAKMHVASSSVMAFGSPQQLGGNYAANYGNFTWGLATPAANNNADAVIGDFKAYGMAWGMVPSEHLNCTSYLSVYCSSGLVPNGWTSGPMSHSMRFGMANIESGVDGINMGLAQGQIVMYITSLDCEAISSFHVADSSNFAYGIVNLNSFSQAEALQGASHLTINFIET
jgi:hypothetical protein